MYLEKDDDGDSEIQIQFKKILLFMSDTAIILIFQLFANLTNRIRIKIELQIRTELKFSFHSIIRIRFAKFANS
jgi:hypothetical protein